MDLLIKNIDIVTMDDCNKVIKNGYIGIKDDKISLVSDSLPKGTQWKEQIDGKRKIAIPGLVNGHSHSAMTLMRNYADDMALETWLFDNIFPVEAKLTEEFVYWGTMLGIVEMLKSGVIAFADMYMFMEEVARAVTETGIKANICKSPVQFFEDGELKRLDKSQGTIDYYNKYHNAADGRIKVFVEIHSTYMFNERTLANAAALAKQLNTGIHIHLLETAAEVESSNRDYGMTSVEICKKTGVLDVPVLAAHCVHMTDSDLEIMKAAGASICHNPTSNLKLGSGIARIPDMLDMGINVCLGTDGAASNNNLNMFEEMNLAALIHKGAAMNPQLMKAKDVLKMGTCNGAKALGFEDSGMIKEGMKGDLILIDTDKPHLYPKTNPVSAIVYSAQASDTDTVIIDGKIIMQDRKFKNIDEEKVMFEADALSRKLLT
ncbi:5-methylthioadenosine/S-adenosylhomocysteine deaminase [Ruminiclostridium sufflavum DSM 19573]|uniref:5-methylthioadenosine/S-adenosylhomocysteine deaminase n=1 Tax=Ruminiclostridium sufflavum DSM 19573 TaxID=1121337 RepID=A0A318Y990_9FIRM|nr:amidohydrolase [Ruminiclostridium sufflavum]PYG88868.1 5-methylthioadenosine/S-adenosylhomocysteine deaminase [Ruminiclostridium sufflavum DSM 19573]